ncbi:MAG: phosphatase PAP2 family protein [Bacteroidetes bacterium]|nr:phosphatase PAP2 family protein [Bacteroidota bacterium]
MKTTRYFLRVALYTIPLITGISLQAQEAGTGDRLVMTKDSLPAIQWQDPKSWKPLHWPSLVLPAAGILYGVGAIHNHQLLSVNAEFKDEVYAESPHPPFHLDNYLQFAPAATVFALDGLGIKGKSGVIDQAAIFLISNVILTSTVTAVKNISHEQRPDGSSYSSFPSGHTAEAFAGAELLFQEYRHISPWYGIAGYTAAAATGYLRMYNNKHWFSDVVAGAGVGMLSTKLAYWVYPYIKHVVSPKKALHSFVAPYYQDASVGLRFVSVF